MIRVRFEHLAAAGRLRRSIFLPEASQPVAEEIDIDPRLYPVAGTAFDTNLHEHPPKSCGALGRRSPSWRWARRGLRRSGNGAGRRAPDRIAFEESAECPQAAALPWELMQMARSSSP